MAFCLSTQPREEFLKRIKDGSLDPQKVALMDSATRHQYFKDFMGEDNALKVNALFESKLLLKHQTEGIVSWAKKVSGLSPEAKRDIISKAERMTEVLNPVNKKAFLSDLAAQRLGFRVTLAEAENISRLSERIVKAKTKMNSDFTFSKFEDRMELGRAKVAFINYVSDLKNGIKKPFKPFEAISAGAGIAKSLKASLDNSVLGRQGLKTLFSNPTIWGRNAVKSFGDIVRQFKGEHVLDEIRADVMSRPNALNGLYAKEKLATGVIEEAFPTSLPEKIPGFGRAFKASEAAFLGFQYRTRADVFDKYVEIAQRTGADIKGIGRVVNSLTGRGNVGAFEPIAGKLNNIFFSPRFVKSNLDFLTGHVGEYGKMGSFARKQAGLNLLKTVAGISAILAIAKALDPDSVETDPRSSNFGKIKIGNTRFDVTGGMGSLATLASRLGTASTKSGTTGITTSLLNPSYGQPSLKDVVYNFLEGKFSPASSMIFHIMEGKDYQGHPLTVGGALSDLLLPLPAANYIELSKDPNSAPIVAALIADSLGIGTNTYGPQKDWESSTSKELMQFKKQIGAGKFKVANDEFNSKYGAYVNKIQHDGKFQRLDPETQKSLLVKKQNEIKSQVFYKYGFTYRRGSKKPLPNIR